MNLERQMAATVIVTAGPARFRVRNWAGARFDPRQWWRKWCGRAGRRERRTDAGCGAGLPTRDPDQTYFFNSWNDKSDPARMVAIDYALTVPLRGGSLVRVFEYNDIGKIWANAEGLKIEGIAPYPAVFDGQFLQIDVISVERRP